MENCKEMMTTLVPKYKSVKEDGLYIADERLDGLYIADERLSKSMIGSFLYLTTTRPDINLLSRFRFMQKPTQLHYNAAKWLLRYVKGAIDFGIWYKSTENAELCWLHW